MGNSSQTPKVAKTPQSKVTKTPSTTKTPLTSPVVKTPAPTSLTPTSSIPTSSTKPKYIYVLQLEGGCYYVGSTGNVDRRVAQHKSGDGAEWTKKHKVIKLMYFKEAADKFAEDNETKIMMSKHGIDMVRGGTYCQVVLPKESIDAISKEMCTADDLCFKCKGKHLARYCTGGKTSPPTPVSSPTTKAKTSGVCERCGRSSHDASSCYANTNTKDAFLCSADTNQGRKCKKTVAVERGLCSVHKR